MPGAGSLKSIDYIERSAPKDGTSLNLFDFTQITNSLITPDKGHVFIDGIDVYAEPMRAKARIGLTEGSLTA